MNIAMDRRHFVLAGLGTLMASKFVKGCPAIEAPIDVTSLAKWNSAFAFDYYAQIRSKPGNLFFSPLSISTAFGMTSLGAGGNTRDEMLSTFHLSKEDEKTHPAFAELLKQLIGKEADPKKRGYQLSVANALWGQVGYQWKQVFLDATTKHYGAGLRQVDFKGDADNARKTVNTWVADQTNQKIKDLLKPTHVTPLTRLILTNAIYFKGDWATQFNVKHTRDGEFLTLAGDKVQTPLMSHKLEVPYYESSDMQAIELPYKGKELSMLIMLPKKRDGLPQLEKTLNVARIGEVTKGLFNLKNLEITLPKFKVEQELDLKAGLIALGMKDAWSPANANFTGLNEKDELYLSAAVHKAFVEVNEEGTEAAAATGIVFELIGAPVDVPVFRADHPFVFAIRDKATGSILFLGRVANPKA